MTLIARKYSFSRMLERMTAAPISLSGVATGFGALSGKMGVSGVSLREALFGSAFSISLSGQGVVAMSSKLAGALSSDETDAVLAHELSHIKNGDSAESLSPSTQCYGWWKQQFTESANSGLTKCLLNSQESLERLRLRS